MASALALAALLSIAALSQPPGPSAEPAQKKTKQPADGGKKADSGDASLKAALAHDPDVQVARAKVLLAEAELAKARQAVVLKVMTLRASIEEHRRNVEAASERLAWSNRMVQSGQAPQSSLLDERARVEAAKAALMRAETELKLLTGSGNEMGLEASPGTTDPAVEQGLLWLSRQMLHGSTPDASGSSAAQTLAALLAAQGTKTPVGAVPERIRAALDKPVKIGAKGEKVTFDKAMEVFKKEAGLDAPVRGPIPAVGTITSDGESIPVGAWFQLFEDQGHARQQRGTFYVREYGILFASMDMAPADAPTLTEFWKRKPPTKEAKEVLDPIKKPEK
jgi:hypothetical protein